MKLKNLRKCYVYTSDINKVDGETQKLWKYKDTLSLNVQQDINELDKTVAGVIDFEKLKIRFDYKINIDKGDGLSLDKLEIKDGFTIEVPKYVVTSKTVVGKSITIICEINHKK